LARWGREPPLDWFDRAQSRADKYADKAPLSSDNRAEPADALRYLAAMQTAHAGEIAALRREVEIYRGLLDSLGETHAGEVTALRSTLTAREGELVAFRGLVDILQHDLDAARAQALAAQDAAEALRQAENYAPERQPLGASQGGVAGVVTNARCHPDRCLLIAGRGHRARGWCAALPRLRGLGPFSRPHPLPINGLA
jgi:hypothetical protein